jgi:hypothetical protein
MEQSAAEWQHAGPSAVGEEAEVANARKASRQDMLDEVAQELSEASVMVRCLLRWAVSRSPTYCSTSFQLVSGSNRVIAVAVSVVVLPRSFWSNTPS